MLTDSTARAQALHSLAELCRANRFDYARGLELLAGVGVAATWDSVQMAPYAMWAEHGVFQDLWLEDARAIMAKRRRTGRSRAL